MLSPSTVRPPGTGQRRKPLCRKCVQPDAVANWFLSRAAKEHEVQHFAWPLRDEPPGSSRSGLVGVHYGCMS
ncbi:hypothetical protein MRX96_012928 [Rhipicephalus microplus]